MAATNCADRSEMDLSAIALQGLQQADAQLNAAASKIASFGASSPDGAGLDPVDLSAEVAGVDVCTQPQRSQSRDIAYRQRNTEKRNRPDGLSHPCRQCFRE